MPWGAATGPTFSAETGPKFSAETGPKFSTAGEGTGPKFSAASPGNSSPCAGRQAAGSPARSRARKPTGSASPEGSALPRYGCARPPAEVVQSGSHLVVAVPVNLLEDRERFALVAPGRPAQNGQSGFRERRQTWEPPGANLHILHLGGHLQLDSPPREGVYSRAVTGGFLTLRRDNCDVLLR